MSIRRLAKTRTTRKANEALPYCTELLHFQNLYSTITYVLISLNNINDKCLLYWISTIYGTFIHSN